MVVKYIGSLNTPAAKDITALVPGKNLFMTIVKFPNLINTFSAFSMALLVRNGNLPEL